MKQFRSTYIEQAEIFQLILLANLYGQKTSESFFFQGGTAIRWCYGGSRFSEDLDFETHLEEDEIRTLLRKALPGIKRDLTANLGPGKLELQTEGCRKPLCTIWAKFGPADFRGKIAVKLEFQQARRDMIPDTQMLILGTLPSIAERIRNGRLETRGNTILTVETLSEIMAGKVRALLERKNYKGRDFWDIWYLGYSLQVKIEAEILARKLAMYTFTLRRSKAEILRDLAGDSGPVVEALAVDLKRFVPAQTFAALEKIRFEPLMTTVREVLANVPNAVF